MRIADHVVDLIGNTPLVKLTSVVAARLRASVAAKVEYLNPGGSSKDRIAVKMIDAAEASGELKPGGTIVEPTSGNTGIGLALVAQQRGYKCVFVCPDKVSEDKRNVLRAYGAEVVVCPTAVAPEHPNSYYSVSDRLVREIPGAWKPNQYANPGGPESHYETTGPEIWADTDGKITHFVAGVGTGGTITGTGRYLKEVSGGKVKVIGADPEGSVYSGGTGRPYLVEGVGEDFWPTRLRPVHPGRDHRRLRRRFLRDDASPRPRRGPAGRRLLRHGRRRGTRSGRARGPGRTRRRAAARRRPRLPVARSSTTSGWRRTASCAPRSTARPTSRPSATCCAASRASCPTSCTRTRRRPCATRSRSCASTASRRCPSSARSRPVMAGEVAGSVTERDLLSAVFEGRAAPVPTRSTKHMSTPFPLIGAGEPVSAATKALGDTDALMVVEDGKPVGVITRHDLLGFLSAGA